MSARFPFGQCLQLGVEHLALRLVLALQHL